METNSVEPSVPRELFPLPAADFGWSPYDATSDGQRFLVRATPAQAGQPMTVIVNWLALLKKGVAVKRRLENALVPRQCSRRTCTFIAAPLGNRAD
jgi:hypothetical protein